MSTRRVGSSDLSGFRRTTSAPQAEADAGTNTEAAPAPTECAPRRVELLEKELLEAKKEAGLATERAAPETATPEVEGKEEANAVASVDESVPVGGGQGGGCCAGG